MYAYVGSRTTMERNARGLGITVYEVDKQSGKLNNVQTLSTLDNPSYLTIGHSGRFLYCVHGDRKEASCFRISPADGTLTYLNTQSTDGLNPAHLAVDPSNKYIVVSNHYNGSLAVLPINNDGTLGKISDLVKTEGEVGPHRIEQKISKPHYNLFDPQGKFIIVPDKGLDRIFSYSLDTKLGILKPAPCKFVDTREGAGPRHAVFHPNIDIVYVVNELDSTVTSYKYNRNTAEMIPRQVLSSLPDTFIGANRAAGIDIDNRGRYLYASNRGHNSIAVFQIDSESGSIKFQQTESTRGLTPRFFTLSPSGKHLYAANEDSDTIVIFNVSEDSGNLIPSGYVINTGSPVCIVFGTESKKN